MSENVRQISEVDFTVLTALQAAFNNMYNVTEACDYAGISRVTYYDWIKSIDGFKDRMEQAKRMPFRKLKEVVVKTATEGEGDANLALRVLQSRDPDFKQKVAIEVDPTVKTLEDKMKEFLDDPNTRPDSLPDDSQEAAATDTNEA